MTDLLSRIAANLQRVRDRIAAAAALAGRPEGDIRLVAVTKYVDVTAARALVEAGCLDLGESRPQDLWRKAAALADLPVRWHLVGHLQRNKARRSLPLVHLLQSADSWRLLEDLDKLAAELHVPARVLLEVNVSGDSTKHGLPPDQLPALIERLPQLGQIHVLGLMTMASLEHPGAAARQDFAELRQLRDRLLPQCPPRVELRELSMGMSGDFEQAIAEGATMVRIGSALFEE